MMKKSEALRAFNLRKLQGKVDMENLTRRRGVEEEIRKLAAKDEAFESIVFELGCSTLAKQHRKINGPSR